MEYYFVYIVTLHLHRLKSIGFDSVWEKSDLKKNNQLQLSAVVNCTLVYLLLSEKFDL